MSQIKVTGSATLKVAPDTTRIGIAVNRTFKVNDEAYETAKRNSFAIANALTALGLEPELAKTDRFDISENRKPVYRRDKFMGYEKNGYELEQHLHIDLAATHSGIDTLCAAITENVPYVEIKLSSLITNVGQLKLSVLKMAVQDASAKAETIASALGCRLGTVASVVYGDNTEGDFDYDNCCVGSTPLAFTGNDETFGESVTVTWNLG